VGRPEVLFERGRFNNEVDDGRVELLIPNNFNFRLNVGDRDRMVQQSSEYSRNVNDTQICNTRPNITQLNNTQINNSQS